MLNIKFDDLLKAVDSLSPEQKRLLRERIDNSDSESEFRRVLKAFQADMPTNIPEEEVQADVEAAIREVRSKKG